MNNASTTAQITFGKQIITVALTPAAGDTIYVEIKNFQLPRCRGSFDSAFHLELKDGRWKDTSMRLGIYLHQAGNIFGQPTDAARARHQELVRAVIAHVTANSAKLVAAGAEGMKNPAEVIVGATTLQDLACVELAKFAECPGLSVNETRHALATGSCHGLNALRDRLLVAQDAAHGELGELAEPCNVNRDLVPYLMPWTQERADQLEIDRRAAKKRVALLDRARVALEKILVSEGLILVDGRLYRPARVFGRHALVGSPCWIVELLGHRGPLSLYAEIESYDETVSGTWRRLTGTDAW